ncbi:MAG: hypothetical protein RLY20_2919 [Verrucomicrobiota bacterium]|jgi:hypothetical protein
MDWIKRNILFVIGGVISLLLMGLAGWYLYSSMDQNAAALEKLNAEYATLEELSKQNPHPGNEQINNISEATNQTGLVRRFIANSSIAFRPIPAIPEGTKIDNAMLAGALRRTFDQLRKDAASRGVQVATNTYFSFTAEKDRIMFDKPGLLPLAQQLGEVKAICDTLFAARINVLDGIRREKVCVHDVESTQTTDYHDRHAVTNDVGVITSYEVSLRCFSSEVGNILGGFASSQNGMIVRAINVEPAVLGGGGADAGVIPGGIPTPVYPQPMTQVRRGGFEEGGMRPPTPYTPPPAVAAVGATTKGGLQTMLDEKQLKVTLQVDVIKLNPKK